jgi:DNA (cytosine-5)-methyltransferase 1
VSEPLRVLSLFAGIGGFDLGLERTGGFKTVAFCEIDPFARRVLAKHWPEVPCYDDVRTLTAEQVGEVDGIVGGFPCQDASIGQTQWGKRVGIDGARTGLWAHYHRLIGDIRPSFALLENVPGLLTAGFGRVLGDLAEIGYDAEWRCVPASTAGLPHRRDRLWIAAYPSGSRLSRPVEGQSLLESAEAAFALAGDEIAGPWRALDRDLDGLRDCHGLSVTMDRHRVKQVGNAVVPAFPEMIGRAILASRGADMLAIVAGRSEG